MINVVNTNGTITVTTPDTVGAESVNNVDYIIPFPDSEAINEIAFYGADNEANCIATINLTLDEAYTDIASAQAGIVAAGGLVFLNGVQQ